MDERLISRSDAIASGTPRYFTGLPCKHGHVSERYTANKTCVECANATSNKTKSKDRQKYIDSSQRWEKLNPIKVLGYRRKYAQRESGKRNEWTANYRAAKAKRMPIWLTDGHIFEIECVYTYCAALRKSGLDYHVDHVVPLRGTTVSGLHVPWNLQVLPGSENTSKGNKFNG